MGLVDFVGISRNIYRFAFPMNTARMACDPPYVVSGFDNEPNGIEFEILLLRTDLKEKYQ
jgi:hypothetical protein